MQCSAHQCSSHCRHIAVDVLSARQNPLKCDLGSSISARALFIHLSNSLQAIAAGSCFGTAVHLRAWPNAAPSWAFRNLWLMAARRDTGLVRLKIVWAWVTRNPPRLYVGYRVAT